MCTCTYGDVSVGFASGVMGSLQIFGNLTAAIVGTFVQVLCCVCVVSAVCIICVYGMALVY